jgi:hypothetical protein
MKKIKTNSTIEEDILLLQEKGKNSSISIGEILNILSEKGQSLIILFLSLPFCQPLQIPGLSTPFGLAIAFLGLKMAFGKYAWLPKGILAKSITPQTLQKISEKLLWLLKKMNYWIYPRITWLCYNPSVHIINGLLISILGILLALPLPTPFSNLMAAWSILFIGLGLLKDDGIFILIGYFVSLFTFGYFVAMVLLIKSIF